MTLSGGLSLSWDHEQIQKNQAQTDEDKHRSLVINHAAVSAHLAR